jgi:hypothetical protein
MSKPYSRRNVLKNLAGGAALLSTAMLVPSAVRAEITKGANERRHKVAEA